MYTFQTTHSLTQKHIDELNKNIHSLIREYVEEKTHCKFDIMNSNILIELTNTILEQAKYPIIPIRSERN